MHKLLILILITFNLFGNNLIINKLEFRADNSEKNKAKQLHPQSHINMFLPSIPYSYIAKATNAGLIRAYDNDRGWVYDLAKSHIKLDDFTYIFELRDNLKFQNGQEFTIDDAIYNLNYFKKHPFLYTNIDKINFNIFKVDSIHLKIVLKQKYEMFLTDLARVNFYTREYIERINPIGAYTGTANKIPGKFGMGPYFIKSGYAEGRTQTDKIELEANPYYWDRKYPKIKRITVFTQLKIEDALEKITKYEGKLDFMPIPFNKKLEVILSDYSKLIVSNSIDNLVILFNLINGNKKLLNQKIRVALNQALNQENLIKFVYKNEGEISPFTTSINYKIVKEIAKEEKIKEKKFSDIELKYILNGLVLKIFTQDRFLFLFKGIEYQLKKYGVKFSYKITTSEKDIYEQLLSTKLNKNTQSWDLLVWGDNDWYYQNPWTVFFIYKNNSAWSIIPKDDIMQKYINEFFITKIGTKHYKKVVKNILLRARKKAYTLRIPSLNKVIAINKELICKLHAGGLIPLRELEISNNHWSIREGKPYPENLKKAIKPKRINYDKSN